MNIVVMLDHIGETGFDIAVSVEFHCLDRDHKHGASRCKTCLAALDVQKFFCPEITAESRLRHRIIRKTQSGIRGAHGVAAVGNIGKGTAVNDCRRTFQRLYQIGTERFFQQHGHRPLSFQIPCLDFPFVISLCNGNISKAFFQILKTGRQTEYRHHFRSHSDTEMVFPDNTVGLSAHTDHHMAQRPIVHIQTALERNGARVNAQIVSLLQVIVDQRAKQIVCAGDRMKIAGKMQVDLFHRDDLGVAAARCAALHTEDRSEGRLAQGKNGLFPDLPEAVGKSDGDRCLTIALFGGGHSRDQNEFALAGRGNGGKFRLEFSVLFVIVFFQPQVGGDPGNIAYNSISCNFNIAEHSGFLLYFSSDPL